MLHASLDLSESEWVKVTYKLLHSSVASEPPWTEAMEDLTQCDDDMINSYPP